MNQPINMSNTQEPDKNIPVRQLPKKRKFFPSELEEIDKSSNDLITQKTNTTVNKSPVTVSVSQPSYTSDNTRLQQSVVIIPPQSVAVDYSFRESEPSQQSHLKYVDVNSRFVPHDDGRTSDAKSVKINCLPINEPKKSTNILISNSTYPSGESGVCIELNEWINHRVLAKQNNIYLPGIIKQANAHGEVWVDLDYLDVKSIKYSNLFTSGKFDIISDASPSKGQLTIGTSVCVRKEMKDPIMPNVFVEGVIIDIINNPMCFVVRVHVNEELLTVKRADLRLLLPPWWDELADLDVDHGNNANIVLRGFSYQDEGSYNNNMIHSNMMPEQNGLPLQLNQVVPTVQGGNDYYRSTATSPLHLTTPVSHNSTCTPLSNGSVDELRQPQYEDFCESDDDLRREDILFPSDAGIVY